MAMTPEELDGTRAITKDTPSELSVEDITAQAIVDDSNTQDAMGPLLENIRLATINQSTGRYSSAYWANDDFSITPSIPQDLESLEDVDLSVAETQGEIEAARDKRLTLLARKYENKSFAVEEEARLKLLTERLRRLIPRVSYKDWENLADIAEKTNQFDDRHKEIRKRLGLDR